MGSAGVKEHFGEKDKLKKKKKKSEVESKSDEDRRLGWSMRGVKTGSWERGDASFVTVRSVCFSSVTARTRSGPPATPPKPPLQCLPPPSHKSTSSASAPSLPNHPLPSSPPTSANTCPPSWPPEPGCNLRHSAAPPSPTLPSPALHRADALNYVRLRGCAHWASTNARPSNGSNL